MDIKEALITLTNACGVSGQEYNLNEVIIDMFKDYVDSTEIDSLGNVIFCKKGTNNDDFKIMLAAHMDEIGLMVTRIEDNGFLRFTEVGGVDPRTIVGQEVLVHGSKVIPGIIGTKPPHMMDKDEQEKSLKIKDMIIDTGYRKQELIKYIHVGDFISIKRETIPLANERISGKSMDDRVGVAVLYDLAKRLSGFKHYPDVYMVCTVQEEVTMSGGTTSAYSINPNIGIAIDVGFGHTPELNKSETLMMGKGPGITLGGNVDNNLRKRLIEIAKEYNTPYQHSVEPGPTGTDGCAIQITKEGIPTLVISVPLRYMHTSVELVDLKDIRFTSILLSNFIKSIKKNDNSFTEEKLCY
ncbi:M42 family metallopeptidase [Soehngenia saccharolytica]|nr:M42 family metallopeptidase [Soehngenia saccharolytica]